jgi:hypothetical protein
VLPCSSTSNSSARRASPLRQRFREVAAICASNRAPPEAKTKTPSLPKGYLRSTGGACAAHPCVGLHAEGQRKTHQAFRGPKNGQQHEPVEVLQSGHACIVVERVEKPTDNSFTRSVVVQGRYRGGRRSRSWVAVSTKQPSGQGHDARLCRRATVPIYLAAVSCIGLTGPPLACVLCPSTMPAFPTPLRRAQA